MKSSYNHATYDTIGTASKQHGKKYTKHHYKPSYFKHWGNATYDTIGTASKQHGKKYTKHHYKPSYHNIYSEKDMQDGMFNMYKYKDHEIARVKFIIDQNYILGMLNKYRYDLYNYSCTPGARLVGVFARDFHDRGNDFYDRLHNMSNLEFLNAILATRSINPPEFNSVNFPQKKDCKWNDSECIILSSMSMSMNVNAYDNACFSKNKEDLVNVRKVFSGKRSLSMLYTVELPTTVSGGIDYNMSNNEIFRLRILPLLYVVNTEVDQYSKAGTKACVVMPAMDAIHPDDMLKFLESMLVDKVSSLRHVGTICIDTHNIWSGLDYKKDREINGIKIKFIASGAKGNVKGLFDIDDKSLSEVKGQRLFYVSYMNPLGFPGGSATYKCSGDRDFKSDAASSTDLISYLSGVPSYYDKKSGFVKPVLAKNWLEVPSIEQRLANNMKKLANNEFFICFDSKNNNAYTIGDMLIDEELQNGNSQKPTWMHIPVHKKSSIPTSLTSLLSQNDATLKSDWPNSSDAAMQQNFSKVAFDKRDKTGVSKAHQNSVSSSFVADRGSNLGI
ncbi:hypothetical protein CAXC1_140002 [Candidatus Xenohaliotis californiensis]|uniref:Uncharacterized protein n=1 Tax=Candidatus Xenohaliotis californiensis TaxID=84677 RepID=A0ABM9N770_9RICK|nr:hypothetical protein CAXC1_140002 [Candidatus Xenohaliotis californiensis]